MPSESLIQVSMLQTISNTQANLAQTIQSLHRGKGRCSQNSFIHLCQTGRLTDLLRPQNQKIGVPHGGSIFLSNPFSLSLSESRKGIFRHANVTLTP